MKRIYPAIFHVSEEGGYWVSFPDLEGCFTQGETLEEAYAQAKEVLALQLDNMESVPDATLIDKVETEADAKVMLVEAGSADDIVYVRKSEATKMIEKGLEEKGFTKYQVAQILAVDRSYVTHIVKGDRIPSVDMAKRFGALLGFDWKIFFDKELA